jgi:hypothetical protein
MSGSQLHFVLQKGVQKYAESGPVLATEASEHSSELDPDSNAALSAAEEARVMQDIRLQHFTEEVVKILTA